MTRIHIAIVGVFSLFILSASAFAGPAEDLAREKTKTATAAFNLGQYTEAAAEYEAAYKAVLDPVLLFNIGQSYRFAGNPEKALTAYRSYLRTASQGAVNRKMVEEKIRDLETEVAARAIDKNPTKPALEENRPMTPSPTVPPDPVPLTIPTSSVDPQTDPPSRPSTTIQGTALPPPNLGDSPHVSTSPSLLSKAERPGWLFGRTWTWVVSGATLVFAGTAITSGVLMETKFDSLDKQCGSASTTRPGCSEDAIDAVAIRRTIANVFWGLAAASVATSGILFFTEKSAVSAAPMVGSANGLRLEGTF